MATTGTRPPTSRRPTGTREGASTYQTNQRGADLLRQAVNYGYQEGFRTGLADRQDRWGSNVGDSYAYRDANYGYAGYYVDREDYNAYFREGFRRGYDDGYQSRYRYGSYANGRVTILGAVLAHHPELRDDSLGPGFTSCPVARVRLRRIVTLELRCRRNRHRRVSAGTLGTRWPCAVVDRHALAAAHFARPAWYTPCHEMLRFP